MAFEAVALGAHVPAGITEENSIHQMLHWCGFTVSAQRVAIFNDSISSLDDIKMMTPKDITAMQRDFGNRAAGARINFGKIFRCLRKGVIHCFFALHLQVDQVKN